MKKKEMNDKRSPELKKIGCFFSQGNGNSGFHFFKKEIVTNGNIFVHKDGILWRVE